MRDCSVIGAMKDVFAALKQADLIAMLGWQDVRHRYKRSSIGAFWLTISMSIMITTMGVIFSRIFTSSLREFLPFLSIGMILWSFISSMIIEGGQAFVFSHAIIKQLNIPLFVHIGRLLWKNLIIFAHNLIILPLVLCLVWQPLTWTALISLVGFFFLILNLSWVVLLLAIFCARYRDMGPMINSILQICFYVTPIMWMPAKLSARASLYLLEPNPLYHWINIIRAPLLGHMPTLLNWEVTIGLALGGWLLTILIYGRFRHRIAYWL